MTYDERRRFVRAYKFVSTHEPFRTRYEHLVGLHQTLFRKVCGSHSIPVLSTLMSWSNENKSCMRVDKQEFAWEFHQLSCPGQTRTRVAWELTSDSLHESFINSHVLVKREQELHESWQARVCIRVSSTLMPNDKSWRLNASLNMALRFIWR